MGYPSKRLCLSYFSQLSQGDERFSFTSIESTGDLSPLPSSHFMSRGNDCRNQLLEGFLPFCLFLLGPHSFQAHNAFYHNKVM